jgi:hypothetical protein
LARILSGSIDPSSRWAELAHKKEKKLFCFEVLNVPFCGLEALPPYLGRPSQRPRDIYIYIAIFEQKNHIFLKCKIYYF